METNTTTMIIVGTIILAGCYAIYRVYQSEKEKFIKNLSHIKEINQESVSSWISKQDMEEYNGSYTACVLKKTELPQEISQKLKLFNLSNNVALFCIYDRANNKFVKKELIRYDSVDSSFKDDLVEIQFS